MACELCGGGDGWIKTCRTKDGSRIRVCDPCWEVLSARLVIVPGDHVALHVVLKLVFRGQVSPSSLNPQLTRRYPL